MPLEKVKNVIVVFLACVGVGGALGYALGSLPVCNRRQIDPVYSPLCDSDFDSLTWCINRGMDACPYLGPGADGDGPSGPSWERQCRDDMLGLNTDHCVVTPKKCRQKYYCVVSIPSLECVASEKYEPEAWWYVNQANSPDCVVAGS
jgi:hypothetical protein